MQYIHWITYKKDPLGVQETLADPVPGAWRWKDPLTGTNFYIKLDDLKEIVIAGRLIIEQLASGDTEEIRQYLAQRDLYARMGWLVQRGKECADYFMAALWPELPLGEDLDCGAPKCCGRIADYLLIRTGVFYALAYEKMTSEEWKNLRLYSLLILEGLFPEPVGEYSCKPEGDLARYFAAACAIASYEGNHAFCAGMPDVDVVQGGAIRIKEYYLESNRIGEIRGASTLLDNINRHRADTLICLVPGIVPESLIFAGGGHIMAIVPAGKGDAVAAEIEKAYREVCLTVRSVAVSVQCSCQALLDNQSLSLMLGKCDRDRRGVMVPAWNNRQGDIAYGLPADNRLWDFYESNLRQTSKTEGTVVCHSCGSRQAEYIYVQEDKLRDLCPACIRKQIVGSKARKSWIQEECDHVLQAINLARGNSSFADEPISFAATLEDIGDQNGDIAVLYGDGNNFGSLFSSCSCLAQLRYLSCFCEGVAVQATFRALAEESSALGGRKAEIIAIGGDDIFLIVPGTAALQLSVALGSRFDHLFKNLSGPDEEQPTMSIGGVIAGQHTPVRYLFEMAQKLMKNAKKRVRKNKTAGEGSIDIAALSSYAAYEDDVLAHRLHTMGRASADLSLRPWMRSELTAFLNFMESIQTNGPGRGWYYRLRQAAEKEELDYVRLYFQYKVAQLPNDQQKSMQTAWEKLPGATASRPAFLLQEGKKGLQRSPWIDVVEFWQYTARAQQEETE